MANMDAKMKSSLQGFERTINSTKNSLGTLIAKYNKIISEYGFDQESALSTFGLKQCIKQINPSSVFGNLAGYKVGEGIVAAGVALDAVALGLGAGGASVAASTAGTAGVGIATTAGSTLALPGMTAAGVAVGSAGGATTALATTAGSTALATTGSTALATTGSTALATTGSAGTTAGAVVGGVTAGTALAIVGTAIAGFFLGGAIGNGVVVPLMRLKDGKKELEDLKAKLTPAKNQCNSLIIGLNQLEKKITTVNKQLTKAYNKINSEGYYKKRSSNLKRINKRMQENYALAVDISDLRGIALLYVKEIETVLKSIG